ncbi:hypothetical protein [Calothrix sp. NIES-3974]|uniref:hypothetical protein n=1 Tax=Calothrix sp. NIES-3974 TaxID=2005462 RepID=UPI000B5E8093|nr:hypothetical protein [Calothrix sp. NIES-3974]BAZ03458.1 hypothetical protein NIES3974_00840 [Calothrix sp. NIES-3974]
MANSTLSQPLIAKLLSLGECHGTEFAWSQYSTNLHLNDEDIPDLIQIAIDQDLNHLSIEHLEASAPIHARRALGQLKATAAIEPLMELFHKLEDNEWVNEELPKIYGMIGAEAILPLQDYLGNNAYQLFPRLSALNSLEEIARQNPDQETKVAAVLVQQLQKCLDYLPELNAFIITSLINLQAVQSGLVIKHAFDNHCVADDIIGDWELVRSQLGINTDDELLSWENLEEFYQIAKIPPESSIAEEIAESSIDEETAIAATPESSTSEEIPESSTDEEIAIASTPESSIAEEIPESSTDEEIAIAATPESSTSEEIPESSTDEEIAIAATPESSTSEEIPESSTDEEIAIASTPESSIAEEIPESSTDEETAIAATPESSTSEEIPESSTDGEIAIAATPESSTDGEIPESSIAEEIEATQPETLESKEAQAEKSIIELSPPQTTNHHQPTIKFVEEDITSQKNQTQTDTEKTKANKTTKGFGITNQKPKTPKKKKK